MPRDINGNYTLPAGINPVVAGTIIDVNWANPTLSDVATALTDSLSRSGSGGMLAPFRNSDGTTLAPGISWTNEPTSGWYRAALNDFRYSVGNEDIFIIRKTGIELAAGKLFIGFPSVTIQDATLVSSTPGVQWLKSDQGAMYVRYQNPDLTFTWILVNGFVPSDYMPRTGLNLLGNYANDAAAAAGGVPIGEPYRNGSVLMVRVA